jgi:hypothetical protein
MITDTLTREKIARVKVTDMAAAMVAANALERDFFVHITRFQSTFFGSDKLQPSFQLLVGEVMDQDRDLKRAKALKQAKSILKRGEALPDELAWVFWRLGHLREEVGSRKRLSDFIPRLDRELQTQAWRVFGTAVYMLYDATYEAAIGAKDEISWANATMRLQKLMVPLVFDKVCVRFGADARPTRARRAPDARTRPAPLRSARPSATTRRRKTSSTRASAPRS